MTPLPAARHGVDQLVDRLLGADIDALGRLIENQHLRSGIEPAGDQDLLLISSGEMIDGLVLRLGRNAKPCQSVLGWPRARAADRGQNRGHNRRGSRR